MKKFPGLHGLCFFCLLCWQVSAHAACPFTMSLTPAPQQHYRPAVPNQQRRSFFRHHHGPRGLDRGVFQRIRWRLQHDHLFGDCRRNYAKW